jgi:hypothetical protein
MRIDWSFLGTFNSVAFKGWSGGWLWVYTGAVWGACAVLAVILGKDLPDAWLATWLTGLAAYSGIGVLQYKSMRETDWGLVERKAGLVPGATSGATGEHPTPPATKGVGTV